MPDVALTDGNDVYTATRDGTSFTVFGKGGDDILTVGGSDDNDSSTVTLNGGDGNDDLIGDYNRTVFVGGAGNDTAEIPLSNYDLKLSTDAEGRYVISDYYSVSNEAYTIDPSIEQVKFSPSYYTNYTSAPTLVAYADIPKYVGSNSIIADIANTSPQHLVGTAETDVAYFNGDPKDYTQTQLASFTDPITGEQRAGDIVLTATNGSGSFTIASNIDYIHFLSGSLVAFGDLTNTVARTPASDGSVNQQIMGDYYGSHIYLGGTGDDTLQLHGATSDYTAHSITAFAADAPETVNSHGQAINGIALFANNGSGVYVVDPSIEHVQFAGGDAPVNYADILSKVAAAPDSMISNTLHLSVSGNDYGEQVFSGDGYDDRAILDFYPYNFTRDADGDFVFNVNYSGTNETIIIKQSIETVQFPNGPVYALGDLPQHVSGDPTFTAGTDANDLLYAGKSGDQYLVGGVGLDDAHLNGNFWDYALRAVNQAPTDTTPAIHGVELLALNDSGNIFIDSSTETLHMQNGTYIPTSDLSTYITRNAAVGGIGTDGDDDFVQIPTGDQRFVGGAGNDRVFLHGNVRDYSFELVDEAATGTTPAVQGIELHALNHSGDLYIDSSIETVHFLDGLTSSYVGLQSFLPAQIAG